jgi:spore germination cell wall hydrolase CwlJ-like protein
MMMTSAWANDTMVYNTIIAEAASEGYQGMYAVACVIRNISRERNISPEQAVNRYFSGAKRKDLDRFVARQPQYVRDNAREIVTRVFLESAPDTTFGALHFENIEAFGVPYWAKNCIITTKIGNHTFYREIK